MSRFQATTPTSLDSKTRSPDIVAEELGGIPVEYTWFPQATGFIRRTLFAKACDIVIGYAQGDEMVLNTNHYYRSAYALVVKKAFRSRGRHGTLGRSDSRASVSALLRARLRPPS